MFDFRPGTGLLLAIFPAALLVAPDAAKSGLSIPEPSNLALMSIGLAGVMIGRIAAARRERDDE